MIKSNLLIHARPTVTLYLRNVKYEHIFLLKYILVLLVNPLVTKGVTVQVFERHFWKNVERHFFKKWSPNIVDKNVATVLQKNLSLDSIIYLNHFKLIKNYFN